MSTATRTGLVWHERYMWHDTGNYAGVLPAGGVLEPDEHTENPGTKRRIKNLLDATGVTEQLVAIPPRAATAAELAYVHTPDYVAAIQEMSEALGGDARIDLPYGHTPFGAGSYDIAALAAGGVIEAVDAIIEGRVDNAYALVRPIGHHAEPDTGLGFCIFNNAAIGVRHAMRRHGLERVALVDWDVHHGNGAERIFWEEREVLTISIHQDRVFPPDRGGSDAVGAGPGEGYNLNIPLPPGSGVGAYTALFERVVVPALRRFAPDMIIVPCGFDAGAFDSLARQMVHSDCFRDMTRMMMDVAGEVCGGRLLLTHEGGYHRPSVPFFGLAVIEALSGIDAGVTDPWLPLFAGMGQQELQPHQDAVIRQAESRLAGL